MKTNRIIIAVAFVLLLPILAFATSTHQVVLTNRALGIGEEIRAEDVRIAMTSKDDKRAAIYLDEVIGMRVVRPIGANNTVKRDYLREKPLVSSGEMILIVATNGALTISTKAIAREDGALGEIIKAENPTSGRLLSARVTGPGTARINF